jgi:hypothetical protein
MKLKTRNARAGSTARAFHPAVPLKQYLTLALELLDQSQPLCPQGSINRNAPGETAGRSHGKEAQ